MRTLGSYESDHGPVFKAEFEDLDDELRFLRRIISKYRELPLIRDLAVSIIRKAACPQRDKKCQAIAIATWVKDNIYYVHELPERFAYPDEVLRAKAGDCDDFSTLIGALVESIGIPSMLVTMKIGFKWAHIFAAAQMASGALLPLDATNRFGLGVNPIQQTLSKGKPVAIKLA